MSHDTRYEIILYGSSRIKPSLWKSNQPGRAADGATYEEALANVQTIIMEWIETAQELGRAIPQPKGRLMFGCSWRAESGVHTPEGTQLPDPLCG